MTARRPLYALALASALTGCAGPAPVGSIAEYRPGSPPVTREITCEANYVLVARDPNGPSGPFGEHHIHKGENVGFRTEGDGSVTAIAPGYTLALPPGSYAWEVVPASVPPERERLLCEARRHFLTFAKVTGIVAVVAAAVVGIFFIVLVIALANSNFPNFS